ncbi:hypothetical protein T07_9762 [Trichinella nelsoni]|uniref:Uncharacterized protein n=1 Tax=Trichinella nelsoni TaxID=6336 RepID=A0A0V0RB59_9BILA|nr:hypothetical protein T07_9762 [Trichinella nelsoni]
MFDKHACYIIFVPYNINTMLKVSDYKHYTMLSLPVMFIQNNEVFWPFATIEI